MGKFNKNSLVIAVVASLVFVISPITTSAAGPATVNLGSAGDFVILAKSGISTTGSTSITGDIGVSPIAAIAMTGFGLTMDVLNTFSTSALLTGKAYSADYTDPTPVKMTTAVSNMETAYTDAAGRTNPTATELGAGNIGGMTLAPGLYKWSTDVIIPTDVTLSGSANDVWIFQIGQNLTISSAMKIVLSGGAQASNIFWQVAGQTTLGTNSVFNGNILDQTAIVLDTGATLNGRALAQTAVTLDANTVSVPVVFVPTPTNGSCSSTHYSCNAGTSASNVSDTTAWTWSCTGLNGGTSASCSETKSLTPIITPTTEVVPSPILIFTPAPTPDPTSTTLLTPITTPTNEVVPSPAMTVTPGLPNTGISPSKSNILWDIIISSSLFVALFSFYLVQRKQGNN